MFDALTARAIAAELTGTIAHGRVQSVVPLNALTIGFEIYVSPSRRYVLASVEPTQARLQLSTEKLRASNMTLTPFMLLLRKYAKGAFVNRVQAVPHERIIRVEFDHAEHGISTLIAELMGQRANLILLDAADLILDAIKRVSPSTNRARAIQPREPYLPPPPQAKADPTTLTSSQLASLLAPASNEPVWQRLVSTVAGTSPLLARELTFRVTGRTNAPTDPTLASALALEFNRVWRGDW